MLTLISANGWNVTYMTSIITLLRVCFATWLGATYLRLHLYFELSHYDMLLY